MLQTMMLLMTVVAVDHDLSGDRDLSGDAVKFVVALEQMDGWKKSLEKYKSCIREFPQHWANDVWKREIERLRRMIGDAVVEKPKEREKPKSKWPPVTINVLGFKGCKHCADMQPAIRKLKAQCLHVYYWDIDRRPKFAAQFKARGMYPHVALLIDGEIVQQHDGVLCEEKLRHLYTRGENVRAGKGKLDPSKRYTSDP